MNSNADDYNTGPLARVLLALAALLGAFIFLEVATLFVRAADADNIAAQAKDMTLGAPAEPSAQVKAAVDGLKKNNLFAPHSAKQYPISEVAGILGNQALINGQWYKAGDTVADAKILAVEPTKVKVTWNGQEKEFKPMDAAGAGGPQGPGPDHKGGPPAPGAPGMVVVSGPGPGGAPPGLSPEERDQMRERLQNMSSEERQKYREEMRTRLGRRSR